MAVAMDERSRYAAADTGEVSAVHPVVASQEPRARAAWRSWLAALSTDAAAALAAALAYEALDSRGRDAWLDVLDEDAPSIPVPKVALYAPLLSVESDGVRRRRIEGAIAPETLRRATRDEVCALRGVDAEGAIVCVLVSPLYLDFVELLTCVFRPGAGFERVEHDPLRHVEELDWLAEDGASTGACNGECDVPRLRVGAVVVEPTPLGVVVEEMAHAVVAERRARRPPPDLLAYFAHLFGPDFENGGTIDA